MKSLFILSGAALYRWRGAAHPKKHWFPRPFNQIAFALPFALYTYAVTKSWYIFAAVLILTTLGTLTGHGRGLDLGQHDEGEDETTEFLIKWLKPRIPLYWYDMLLLSVTGLAITLPAGIATMNPSLALLGLLKGLCYALSHHFKAYNEGGELLTGAVLWGGLLMSII